MRNGFLVSVVGHRLVHGLLLAGSLAGVLAGTASTAAADDDAEADVNVLVQNLDVWDSVGGRFKLKEQNTVTGCEIQLKSLTEAHAPASLTIELDHDIPELKAGKHPWTAARAACAHILNAAAQAKVVETLDWTIFNCKLEMTANGATLLHYDNAVRTFEAAVKAGVPMDETIEDHGISGTRQALYDKFCVAGRAKLAEQEIARAAPYKKLLKNDKLKYALQDEGFIMLAGGAKVTIDNLASNNVWFEDASPTKVCPNGAQVHVLHRYQFDAAQKLARVTDHEFCGRPPTSALR